MVCLLKDNEVLSMKHVRYMHVLHIGCHTLLGKDLALFQNSRCASVRDLLVSLCEK
jgi:hypothetical protein